MQRRGRAPALLLAVLACDAGPAPTAEESPRAADDLRALGYAGWDEEADPERSGVTVLDRKRAVPGPTCYGDEPAGRLVGVDLEGREVAAWHAPGHDRVEVGLPLDDGGAVLLSTDQGVTRVDRDSRIVWRAPLPCHHDLWPLADGGFLVPVHTERAFRGRRVRFDAVARLDAAGREVGRWDLFGARELLAPHHGPTPLDAPPEEAPEEPTEPVYDYYHLNAVSVVPEDSGWLPGSWLLCLRNVDLVLALDPEAREVLWSFGPGELEAPHHPRVTPGGNVLIFDNGRRRGWSRVVEVDPRRDEVVWEYRAPGFFSEIRGAAQRLPGGNTLITESERGRVFEVTRDGEVVWEYWNPVLEDGARRRIYRALRFPE